MAAAQVLRCSALVGTFCLLAFLSAVAATSLSEADGQTATTWKAWALPRREAHMSGDCDDADGVGLSLLQSHRRVGPAMDRRQAPRPAYLPIFAMHGIFDSAADVEDICLGIKELRPGTECVAIRVAEGPVKSLATPMMTQVEKARHFILDKIAEGPDAFRSGFNLICHSQGGLVCRGLISKWTDIQYPIKTFVSLAGPQQGVDSYSDIMLPSFLHGVGSEVFYQQLPQASFSAPGYWKDMTMYGTYQKLSQFLAVINNEIPEQQCSFSMLPFGCRPNGCTFVGPLDGCAWPGGVEYFGKNKEMQQNFERLEHAVFCGSPADGVIVPWQSTVWGYYAKGNGTMAKDHVVLPFEETVLGKYNLVPLRSMNASGKLHMITPANVTHNDWKIRRSGEFAIDAQKRSFVLSLFLEYLK